MEIESDKPFSSSNILDPMCPSCGLFIKHGMACIQPAGRHWKRILNAHIYHHAPDLGDKSPSMVHTSLPLKELTEHSVQVFWAVSHILTVALASVKNRAVAFDK
jgi:hypothetical protein